MVAAKRAEEDVIKTPELCCGFRVIKMNCKWVTVCFFFPLSGEDSALAAWSQAFPKMRAVAELTRGQEPVTS